MLTQLSKLVVVHLSYFIENQKQTLKTFRPYNYSMATSQVTKRKPRSENSITAGSGYKTRPNIGICTELNMTHKQLIQALGKFNIVEQGKVGDKFDPGIHEALSSEPTDKVEEGSISQVFKKGYKFHDRIIRPAQVVVAVKPSEE